MNISGMIQNQEMAKNNLAGGSLVSLPDTEGVGIFSFGQKNKIGVQKTILQPKEEKEEPDMAKAMKIARKIARGEAVSLKERSYLQKYFPLLLREAELARQEGERVKAQLQSARSEEEQQEILTRESNFILQISKVNEGYADLIAEAVEKACEEVRGSFGQQRILSPYSYYDEVDSVNEKTVFDQKS